MAESPDQRDVQVLAANAGFEIVASATWAWFYDRRTRGPGVAAAVSGGVAGILGINAVVFLLMMIGAAPLGPWPVLVVELGLSAVAAAICRYAIRLRQRRFTRARAELQPLLMVDRRGGMVLDHTGQPLAPLARVPARKGMLVGSSAPALFVHPPGRGRIEVFRGSLLGGGIEGARAALIELGFGS